ncbi:MAG: hypothetical protein JW832_01235 [Deltaproteobacteria bacterium]|nr:hypothetical protein [Deltaproteobacteria bacterium]
MAIKQDLAWLMNAGPLLIDEMRCGQGRRGMGSGKKGGMLMPVAFVAAVTVIASASRFVYGVHSL